MPGVLGLYIGMEVLIALSSVIGNVMVVWAVRINRSLRDTTIYFHRQSGSGRTLLLGPVDPLA